MNRRGNLDMVMKNMEPERATKILAKSLYKELSKNGFAESDIISFSREIIECMANDMKKETAVTKLTGQKDRLLIG
jgi:hypothetical protein